MQKASDKSREARPSMHLANASTAVAKQTPIIPPTDPALVRKATLQDLDGLIALARLMHGEVGVFPVDEERVRAKFAQAISTGIIGVIGSTELHGCICFDVTMPWYTHTSILSEFMFFVHPLHRRTAYARSLIAWGKYISDRVGVPMVMGVFGLKRTDTKVNLCGRQLEYAGSFFMHNRSLAAVMDEGGAPDV